MGLFPATEQGRLAIVKNAGFTRPELMVRFKWGIFLLLVMARVSGLFAAAPAGISDLTALTGSAEGEIILRWTAPGDDGTTGTVSTYAVRYATAEIKSGDFSASWVQVYSTAGWTNFVPAGEIEERILTGLGPRVTYYFAVKGENAAGEFGVWNSSSETAGLANSAGRALAGEISPAAVDIVSLQARWRQISLGWITPGDDATTGDIVGGSLIIKVSTTGPIVSEADWAKVSSVYPYTIFQSTTVAAGISVTRTLTGLTNGTTYYFAVRYQDERQNISPLSLTSPATCPYNLSPASFSLLSPADNLIVNTSSPTFAWEISEDSDSPFGDTVSYYLSYSTDSNFASIVTTTIITGVPAYIPGHYLLEDKTYYWKVVAVDLEKSQRLAANNPRRVKINVVNSAPTQFSLIGPATGQIVNTANPQLMWESAFDPDPGDVLTYQVFYSTDSQFCAYFSSAGISPTNFVTTSLGDNLTYYWKVKVSDGQLSNWSTTTGYFLVNYIPEPPNPFNLSLPLDTTRVMVTNVSFIWQPTSDPDPKETVSYALIYSNFANFVTSITISGLTQYATTVALTDNLWYYWKVRATGSDGQSRFSNQTFSFYLDTVKQLPPDFQLKFPTGSVIISNTLRPVFEWEKVVDVDPADVVQYEIMISEKSDFSGGQWVRVGTTNFYQPAENLLDETTYYWKVRAAGYSGPLAESPKVDDGYTNSSSGTFIVSLTNNPPQPFGLVSPSPDSLVLTKYPQFKWEKSLDTDPDASVTYNLQISTVSDFSVLFFSRENIAGEAYILTTPLKENATYYWRLIARDNKGALRQSNSSYRFYLPVVSILQQVSGVLGEFSSDRRDYQLIWQPVTRNTDGSIADDLLKYQIYRGFSLADLFKPESLLAETTETFYLDRNILGADLYYSLRAVDTSGVAGPYSIILRTQGNGAGYFYSEDKSVLLEIPAPVNELLNNPTAPYRLEIKSLNNSDEPNVLSAYEINLYDARSDALLSGFSFPAPLLLKFYYSQPISAVKKSVNSAPPTPGNLCFYWYNGKQFLRLGGKLDTDQQTISLAINRGGLYQLRAVSRSTNLSVSVNPRRVITPGIAPYEKFQIFVDNPRGETVRGKIFNLKGEKIAELKTLNDPTEETVLMEWNGVDSDGKAVSGGVYIYYVEAGQETKSGTVLVAR